MNHYIVMFIIMILSGVLSTMNIWVDKIDDIRISLNDIYMILLMTSWMFFFMGIYYYDLYILFVGSVGILVFLYCIRNQVGINTNQYLVGMIPHHSMAILMSKRLLEKGTSEKKLVQNIIEAQQKEIEYMKSILV